MSDQYSSFTALALENFASRIPSYRTAWAEFDDGSVGLTIITDEEYKEICERQKRESYHDPLPKHYRDQGA
jgi:hypothetical protein